jgi:hypothetical protein
MGDLLVSQTVAPFADNMKISKGRFKVRNMRVGGPIAREVHADGEGGLGDAVSPEVGQGVVSAEGR